MMKFTKAAAVVTSVALLLGGLTGASVYAKGKVAARPAKIEKKTQKVSVKPEYVSMVIETGKMDHHPGWPKFTNAYWTAKPGTIVLTIRSYDDGSAPVSEEYAEVRGTVGGVEKVDGKVVRSIKPQDVAHTFTIPALGINIPVPVAPSGGSVTVQAVLHITKTGSFSWQCFAPCGTGKTGWGGPMATPGYMLGTIHIKA